MDEVGMHNHSYWSDGKDGPKEIVSQAKKDGVKAICLSDHDVYHGTSEFILASQEAGISTISAMEISAHYKRRHFVHILAYGIRNIDENVIKSLNTNWRGHEFSNDLIIDGVRKHFPISISSEEIRRRSNGVSGPVNFSLPTLLFLAEYLNVSTAQIREAVFQGGYSFEKAVSRGLFLSVDEAMAAIRLMGAKAVLAHPELFEMYTIGETTEKESDELFYYLVELGLSGIETFYPYRKDREKKITRSMKRAKHCGLWLTAGSDYHGIYKPNCGIAMSGMSFKEFMKFKKFCES
jgi:3',5'-nucleoside bisphosphate phosphatase